MKEYLKMSDVFRDSVLSDGNTAYTLIDEADRFGVIHKVNSDTLMCSGADVAEYATHAINSHDELVKMNKDLLTALEALDGIYSDTSRDYLTRAELQHHKAVRAGAQAIIAKAKGGEE